MMGYSHAITGAVTWTATAAVVTPAALGLDGTVAVVAGMIASTLVAAGAAMLADLDQQESTASYSLPPVTNAVAALAGLLAGGHRKGTHSLVGLAAVTLGAYALSWWSVTVSGTEYAPGPAVVTVLLVALAARALKLRLRPRRAWGLSLLAGMATWFLVPHAPVEPWTFASPSWFVVAVAVAAQAEVVYPTHPAHEQEFDSRTRCDFGVGAHRRYGDLDRFRLLHHRPRGLIGVVGKKSSITSIEAMRGQETQNPRSHR